MTSPLRLVPASDAHFAWMLGEIAAPRGLSLPPDGLDEEWVLLWLRGVLATLDGRGSWLMVAGDEVVGLCSYKRPPDADGSVEIGYGVSPARRRRGYATRAVATMLIEAAVDPRVRRLTAETALTNLASQRVVEANGFAPIGRSMDADEGEVIVWARAVR